jgi:hypothetical protein
MLRLIPLRFLLIPLALAGLAVAIVFGLKARRPPATGPDPIAQTAAEPPAEATAPPAQATDPDAELRPQSPAERANATEPPTVIRPASRPGVAGGTSEAARPEPSPYTRQLVAGLTNLDFSSGPISQAQADQWKQALQSLTAQGAGAVPAIREFLDQKYDVNFGASGGAGLLGQTSLRSALINALAQIGGPEATVALTQTLQTTTLPSEIAQVAQVLEQQAPGQYRVETLSAINEVLSMASNGQLPANWDVGTLFKVLQTYGDSTTASALEQLQGPWKYYATMTLAGLQNGEGVPVLIREAQDPAAGGKPEFALQMLAQVAAQYPDAGAALLQQATAGQISDSAWRKIALGLGGDQYQLGEPPPGTGLNADVLPGLKTYHISSGNQNFYSLPPAATDAQLPQRIALIDQLLAANPSSAAVQALQQARATLSATLPR